MAKESKQAASNRMDQSRAIDKTQSRENQASPKNRTFGPDFYEEEIIVTESWHEPSKKTPIDDEDYPEEEDFLP